MRPLLWIAAGLAVVAFDVRTARLDLRPDPIGWGLVVFGASRLSMRPVVVAAALTAALSIVDVQLPYHYQHVDPATGTVLTGTGGVERLVFDRLSGWSLALGLLSAAAGGVTLWLLLRTLERRARDSDPPAASRLRLLRWLVAGVWVAPYVAVLAATGDPVWNGARLELVALAGLATMGGTIGMLLRGADAAWGLQPQPTV